MAASPPASLRASALALLADGNHPHSVAQVLGVPIEQLVRWQQGHGDDAVDQEPPEGAAPASVRPLTFDSEVACGMPLASRVLRVQAGVLLVCMLASLWYFERNSTGVHADTLPLVLISLASLGMISPVVLAARERLVFGLDAVTQHGALFTSRLRYADITSVAIAADTEYVSRGARAKGFRLTFRSDVHIMEPMSWFIDESNPLDQEVVERLRHLPGVSARDVAPLTRLPIKPRRPFGRVAGGVLFVLTAALAIRFVTLPNMAFQQAWRGQPTMAQMTHLSGDLRHSSACHRETGLRDRVVEARLQLADGHVVVRWIPCVLPMTVFADGRHHTLSLDVFEPGDEAPVVYQVALDDRVLLAPDTVRGQRTAILPLMLLAEILLVGTALGVMAFSLRLFDDDKWAPN